MDAGATCVASDATDDTAMAKAYGECLPDPPAGGACNATEVATGSAAIAAEQEPVGISNDCLECVFARTMRKGESDVAVADVEACGPVPASDTQASGAGDCGIADIMGGSPSAGCRSTIAHTSACFFVPPHRTIQLSSGEVPAAVC